MRSLVLLLLSLSAAAAQPADCTPQPVPQSQQMPLSLAIPLKGQPGVPKAASGGYVGLGLGNVPAYGTVCGAAEPALPRDVLGGQPSDDLLSGAPPKGKVYIETK